MPDGESDKDEPNLELPSLGFRRRRRSRGAPSDETPEPPQPEAAPDEEPTRVLAVDEPEPDVVPDPEPDVVPDPEPAVVEEPRRRQKPRGVRMPHVPGPVAAVVTGVVAGLVTVLLAFVAARGCQQVRGVGSCGGFGLVALLVILAIEVLIGALLLTAFAISDPTSTSFLAVGVVAVLAMLFFLSEIDSRWMLLVIPLLTAAAYLLSWWVSRRFVDAAREVRD